MQNDELCGSKKLLTKNEGHYIIKGKGMIYLASNEAQKRATIKYMNEKLEEIKFRVPKGEKETIRKYANSKGMALTAYIKDLIKKDMEGNA